MPHFKNIEKEIVCGLRKTCLDVLNFSGKFDAKYIPDHMTTLNVAKSIGNLNYNYGIPYYIRFEKTYNPGWMNITMKNNNIREPLTSIKVRLLNPSKKKFKEDVIRLSDYLKNNNMKHTYFASILFDKEITTQEEAKKFFKKQTIIYTKWVNNTIKKENISCETKIIPIYESISTDEPQNLTNENLNKNVNKEIFFGGLIIKLNKES